MLKRTTKKPSFDEAVATLRGYKFDVGVPAGVANVSGPNVSGSVQVAKHGCAAVIAPAREAAAVVVVRPGVVIDGEIGQLLDRGYQKFIKTAHAERPATADHLRALHRFSEELRQALGATSLYNESIGTVSDEYWYDRVKGRNLPEAERPKPAWEKPAPADTPGEVR